MKPLIGTPVRHPNQPIAWPDRALQTQVQLVKSASQPQRLAVQNGVQPASNVNMPAAVPIAGISSQIVGNFKRVNITFRQNAGDPFFQKVNIHFQQGTGQPTIIASGATSPIVLTLPRSGIASRIYVQPEGNWGALPLQNCHAKAINLR
jgi:hypothetical protein